MAASIAKLAIILQVDTDKLRAGLNKAQQSIKSFEGSAKSSGTNLAQLFAAGLGFGTATAAASKFFHVTYQGLRFASREAGKLQDRMAELGLIAKEETISSAWKEFGETIGAIALPAVKALTAELRAFTSDIASLSGADSLLAQIKAAEAAQKRMAAAKKMEMERQDVIRKSVAEQAKDQDSLNERARAIADGLRTPGEIMQDSARELGRLLSENLISIETAERAAAKLAEDFQDATKSATKLKDIDDDNPALERGTVAEFSARAKQESDAKKAAELARQQAAEQVKANELLRKILESIDNQNNSKLNLNRGRIN